VEFVELRGPVKDLWSGADVFAQARRQQGKIFKDKDGRRTLRFEFNGKRYFLKFHNGVGWREIIKNLVTLKLPVVGARDEWLALNRLRDVGVNSMIALGFGERGRNPATRESFLITAELKQTETLENLVAAWQREGVDITYKRKVLAEVARIARTIHANGINHRDLYLCHFLVGEPGANPLNFDTEIPVFLVDLHRAQIRSSVPRRWLVKDIGALYYSALNVGFTRRDFLRFLRAYYQKPLRQLLASEAGILRAASRRAIQIHRRDFGQVPVLPLGMP